MQNPRAGCHVHSSKCSTRPTRTRFLFVLVLIWGITQRRNTGFESHAAWPRIQTFHSEDLISLGGKTPSFFHVLFRNIVYKYRVSLNYIFQIMCIIYMMGNYFKSCSNHSIRQARGV